MLLNNYQTALLEAGLDEAGRGCYAGPVFAAAVILPPNFYHPLLNDSKKLTEKNRAILKPIIEKEALHGPLQVYHTPKLMLSIFYKLLLKRCIWQ